MLSSSSGQAVSTFTHFKEAVTHVKYALDRRSQSPEQLFACFEEDYEQYKYLYSKYTDEDINSARIVEIGFGARPYRLATLCAKNLNVVGIDLDAPILDGSLKEIIFTARNNGFERALKSITRHYLTDRIEQKKFKTYHHLHGAFLEKERLLVGSASSGDIWEQLGEVNLITSVDVVEHFSVDALNDLIQLMAEHISDNGLALICPTVFTGITGGHILEWYRANVADKNKKSEPWEHLRQNRVEVNSYLNHLTLSEYRDLFSENFEILEEIVKWPDLGREWYTNEVKKDLAGWPEEELFSNQVIFVMRKR